MSYNELKCTFLTMKLTAIEKVNVLGVEDSIEYINNIISVTDDLLHFWESEIDDMEYDDLLNIINYMRRMI